MACEVESTPSPHGYAPILCHRGKGRRNVSVFCDIDVSANSFVVLCIDRDGKRLGPARSLDNDLI